MRVSYLIFGLVLCLLASFVYAADQVVTAPTPASQGVSFESLSKNLKDVVTKVAELQQDQKEKYAQILAALDAQYDRLLILLIVFQLAFIAFSKLLGRAWDYLIEKRFQRSREDDRSRVFRENKEMMAQQLLLSQQLDGLKLQIASIRTELETFRPPVVPEVQKKRFWEFWKHG